MISRNMLTLAEIQQRLKQLHDWALEGGTIITKEFNFDSFKEALDFVIKIGALAEQQGHHPNIFIEYNVVRLSLTTHSARGLTEKDFDLAAAIDSIKI